MGETQTIIPHSAALHLEAEVAGEVGRLHQYGGFWAIRESDGTQLWNRIRTTDLAAHIASEKQAASGDARTAPRARYVTVEGGVAVVSMAGVMTKYGSSMSMMGEGTLGVRKAMRAAAADKDVKSIVLRIDSPGGSVSGTGELAEDVARITRKKPVHAFIEDLGASAAYWVASQARTVTANKDALVGSIGTYMVVDDLSENFEKAGIKTHVIRAGAFKGAGARGTEITDEQLANWQREVEAINAGFVAAVAKGRGMGKEQAEKLADGRVHTAKEAKRLGLIDAVGSLDDLVSAAGGKAGGLLLEAVADCLSPEVKAAAAAETGGTMDGSKDASVTAAEKPQGPKVATLKELKAAFPKAGDSFYVACADADMTLEQARGAYTNKMETDLAEARSETERLKAEAGKANAETQKRGNTETNKSAGKSAIGVEPVADGGGGAESAAGDPIVAFNKAVDAQFGITKNRAKAVGNVVRADPDLHKAYLEAVNRNKRQ